MEDIKFNPVKASNIRPIRPMQQTPDNPNAIWSDYLIKVGSNQDRSAFKAIFDHFGPLIKSFFMAKFPSKSSVEILEELVQEVMIKVWQKAHSYDPNKAAASTWIFTLARNTRIDMLRRQSKYANTVSLEADTIWEGSTDFGPFSFLQNNREAHDVKESIKTLPNEQALVIHKVYMESKSHNEVAEELDLPLGTVKSRVRLAQAKLQAMFQRPSVL